LLGSWQRVVHQGAGQKLSTGLIVSHFFVEGLPDALGQPTLHLGIHEVRVQDAPTVINGHIGEDVHLAGFGIDLDYCYVSTGRERGARWGKVAPGC
jgi:hypothetical protein